MLVSIVIPSYNDGRYLPYAVESVRKQTLSASQIEIIVVDDGSTDDTSAVAASLDVKVIRQEQQGLPAARNKGIKQSSGKFILPLDADDAIHPEYVSKALNILSANDHVGVVYAHRQHFGTMDSVKLAEQFSIEKLKSKCIINYCSMFRKQVWIDCNGYNEAMVTGFEDWDFWFRVHNCGWSFYLLEEVLFYYRKHPGRLSHIAQENSALLMKQLKINHPTVFL